MFYNIKILIDTGDIMFVPRSQKASSTSSWNLPAPAIPRSHIQDFAVRLLNEQELIQTRTIFDNRMEQPRPWPKVAVKAEFDCEGLSHYLLTGLVGKFDVKDSDVKSITVEEKHLPYTVYGLWAPNNPNLREQLGYWGSRHFFMHLEDGQYISKNGFYEIQIFKSFHEMLEKDGFPKGYCTKDYTDTNSVYEADMGQSAVGTLGHRTILDFEIRL